MKILLLGATGRTGIQIIEEAMERGHSISAIARDPAKLEAYDISITKGTPYDYETVEKANGSLPLLTPMVLFLIVVVVVSWSITRRHAALS